MPDNNRLAAVEVSDPSYAESVSITFDGAAEQTGDMPYVKRSPAARQQALAMLLSRIVVGDSMRAAAAVAGIDEHTGRRWYARYRQDRSSIGTAAENPYIWTGTARDYAPDRFERLAEDYVTKAFDALIAELQLWRSPDWLRQQTAHDLVRVHAAIYARLERVHSARVAGIVRMIEGQVAVATPSKRAAG